MTIRALEVIFYAMALYVAVSVWLSMYRFKGKHYE